MFAEHRGGLGGWGMWAGCLMFSNLSALHVAFRFLFVLTPHSVSTAGVNLG